MIRGVVPQATINVEVTNRDGVAYAGEFTFRRRTLLDRAQIAGRISELSGGRPIADSDLRTMVHMVAELHTCVVRDDEGQPRWPDWFDKALTSPDFDDTTLLFQVYGRYADWRDSFRAGRDGEVPAPETPARDPGAPAGDDAGAEG